MSARPASTTRPTGAVLVPLALAAVLYVLARVAGGGWLPLGACALLVLPVAAVLLRPRLADVVVTATSDRASAGGEVVLQLEVGAGDRPSPALRVVLAPGLLGGASVAVPALAAGTRTAGEVRLPAPARGTTDGLDVELVSTAPFGLVRVRRRLRPAVRIVVHPVPVVGGQQAAGTGAARSTSLPGAGTEVLGVRHWRRGDAPGSVHARSSARAGRPVVLEREREQGARLVVLFESVGSGPAWEREVAQVAGQCLQVLRQGGEPLLVGAAPSPRPSRDAVLDWLAGLEAAGPAGPADTARAVRAAGRSGAITVLGRAR